MTTITLESIKAEQTKLADHDRCSFESATTADEQIHFPEVPIDLAPGEHYAGIIVGKDGEPSYHLVLFPARPMTSTLKRPMKWAWQAGLHEHVASLPTRREQALLYANLKEHFKKRAYWSCEAHASESGWAWYQNFNDGSQDNYLKDHELRARAVRRLIIE